MINASHPETQPRNVSHRKHGLSPHPSYESQFAYGREKGSRGEETPETHPSHVSHDSNGFSPHDNHESHDTYGRESLLPMEIDKAKAIAKLLQKRRRKGESPTFRPHFFLFEPTVRILENLRKTRIKISNLVSNLIYDHGVRIEEIEDTFIADALITVKLLEDHVSKNLRYLLEENRLAQRLIEIPGVSYDLAAQFIAEVIDLRRFKTLRSLYHYAGLHVVDGHAPTLKDMAEGKTSWNQKLRTIMYKIVMQVLKAHGRKPNKYGELYYEAKKRYEERGDYKSKLHLHLRAARIVAKRILRDLYHEFGPAPETHLAHVSRSGNGFPLHAIDESQDLDGREGGATKEVR